MNGIQCQQNKNKIILRKNFNKKSDSVILQGDIYYLNKKYIES